MTRRVAVVLASVGRGPAFDRSVDGFVREVGPRGEVVVVERGAASAGLVSRPGVRFLSSGPCRLVPEMWRDGLAAVDAGRVAFSTTQMIPRAGWLDRLMDRMDETGAWGVGGTITAGDGLGPVDRAVYLQRFLGYGPGSPLPARPSGENGLYRCEKLSEVARDWSAGFWEIKVQQVLEACGATWASEPRAVVDFAGTTSLLAIARERFAHARWFGAERISHRKRVERVARGLAWPLVPAVLLGRVGRSLIRRRMGLGPWLGAMPSFLAIGSAWAAGEAIGAWLGRGRA
jgi:hypothetical protein